MKKSLIILIFLFTIKTLACDCQDVNPVIEFYESDYVFVGKIISKTYANDSLTYKVTFNISKHYKNGDFPKELEFELNSEGKFNSEGKYIGKASDCDLQAEKGEVWLVYTKKYKGELRFGSLCSNSKNLNYRKIGINEQRILNNGNSFKLENYIYDYVYENGFNYTKPISNIDSIFQKGKIKDYEKPFTWLNLLIDKKGNLKYVTTYTGYQLKFDSIFNLPTEFKIKLRKPLTEFEKDAIKLVKKIKKWEIKRHEKINIPVFYIRHLTIEFDKEKKIWKYEL